ncbi:hypothetical protein [Lachnoclostridium sp. An131]|uniref:hypothetical protein n=1 Tax=Lachnoclostridium sp. An131 TaxID=1965555 RepID=UPI001FA9154B|nr:hypothetical protein [Lachnoclostridium sp. An131]
MRSGMEDRRVSTQASQAGSQKTGSQKTGNQKAGSAGTGMARTLRITFSLRNTYRVNNILYALKQIPLVGRILPETLYQEPGLKILANIISVLWEIFAALIGKGVYFLILLGAAALYPSPEKRALFLYLMVICTVLGGFVNTYMFNPTKDKYYALILLRMDARSYTLVNYGYALIKLAAAYLLFGLLTGGLVDLPVWQRVLLPLFAVGVKLFAAAYMLRDYEKTGNASNENKVGPLYWAALFLGLAAAFGLPAIGIFLPETASLIFMGLGVALGAFSARRILRFAFYREMYQELLGDWMDQMDKGGASKTASAARKQSEKAISADTGITSSRNGFEYLNELFIKRHQRILWRAAEKIAFVCLILVLAALIALSLYPEVKTVVNELTMQFLPYFVFILYAINRGTGFTQALFINCDSSLLTYSFYKKPGQILKLFRIRLREIIKINLLPAFVIGAGLAVLLFASGGTDNPVNYAVLVVSVLCMSVFFSVHYLMIYYLLQPYTAGAEMKSGTYKIVMTVTYFVCYLMMRVQMPTFIFGLMTIVFCVAYSVIACVVVYRMAPKTFKLRL